MSVRAMSSSMKCCGMRPKCRVPRGGSAEFLLDPCAERAHVGAALRLPLHEAHDLPHVLERRGTRGGNRLGDEPIDLRRSELRRQVRLQYPDLGGLLRHQVAATAALEL